VDLLSALSLQSFTFEGVSGAAPAAFAFNALIERWSWIMGVGRILKVPFSLLKIPIAYLR
jgi:hypothetical protein